MKFLEYLYYESLPYIYATIGAFGLANHETSKVAAIGGFVLAACAYQVFYFRYFHRTTTSRTRSNIRI